MMPTPTGPTQTAAAQGGHQGPVYARQRWRAAVTCGRGGGLAHLPTKRLSLAGGRGGRAP